MDRCAIFVDAGYLFAQGSTSLTGSKKPRAELVIDAPAALEQLKAVARDRAAKCEILRVYWYDGAMGGLRPTSDQALIANLDDIKLRLGFINSQGQQKGVDSLIVTDLIELARLKSICDAVLLSGDEDVRVGVQIAQNYGVRVHLLGIAPSRASQSNQLIQEADTTTEWSTATIEKFLALRDSDTTMEGVVQSAAAEPVSGDSDIALASGKIEIAVQAFVEKLTETDIQGVEAYWKTARGVPADLDKKLLPSCGTALGRNLAREEIRHMRSYFQRLVKRRIKQNSN